MIRDELARRALALHTDGRTYEDIATELADHYEGREPFPTRGWVAALIRDARRAGGEAGSGTEATIAAPSDTQTPGSYTDSVAESSPFLNADARRARLRSYLGTSYAPTPYTFTAPRETRVVVAVGDFHGNPDQVVLRAIVEADPDVLVIGGDMLDNLRASSHAPETRQEAITRRQATARDELAEIRATLEVLLDETRAAVKVLTGNHDAWVARSIIKHIGDWALEFWRDPLDMLCDGLGARVEKVGFPVVHFFEDGTNEDTGHNNEFMYVLNDVMFSHLNFTSTVTESGVSKLYRFWFSRWERPLRLQHVKMIVHFHTHQRSMMSVAGGHVLLAEPGMGGGVTGEAYKYGYQGKWGPSVRGLLRFAQFRTGDGWQTDLGSVDLIAPRVGSAQGTYRRVA